MHASASVIKNILEISLKKPGKFYKLAEDCFFPSFPKKKEFLQVQGSFQPTASISIDHIDYIGNKELTRLDKLY